MGFIRFRSLASHPKLVSDRTASLRQGFGTHFSRESCAKDGGERGIRTPGTLPGTAVFKTAAIDHSAISPLLDRRRPLHPD